MKTKVNEIQISYHGNQTINTTFKIGCSQDAAQLAFEHWDQNHIEMQEHFKILLLNNSNIVKGIYEVSKGGITGTLVDLRILFAVVLKSLSTAIILLHNHPSGTLKPSEADRQLTQKIIKAGKLLDVKVLDHLIITPNKEYYSFADQGVL